MIEQSFEHGAVYLSEERSGMLISKAVKVSDISFGPWRHIRIAKKKPFVFVEDTRTKTIYLYEDELLQVKSKELELPNGVDNFYYYYGLAKHKNEGIHTYFIQNRPKVSYEAYPNIHNFSLPRTLDDIGYKQNFTYPYEIKKLLSNIQASYVDRYKRPVQHIDGRTFPVNIDNVSTTLSDLKESNYPFVINLEGTKFAMVDLEPGYSEKDHNHFKSLDGYYIEETPNGGKHMLVKTDSKVYKYRYSDHLEIINESMVSIYGINAKFLTWKPKPIDLSIYKSTNKTKTIPVKKKKSSEKVEKYVKLIEEQSIKTASSAMESARQQYEQNNDLSYAEYLAIYILYIRDILPYKDDLPYEELPWILESYASKIIPWRDKHDSQRNNVPYLVHLANEVIQYREREAKKS